MRKNIVAGNWKMNKTLQEGIALAKELNEASTNGVTEAKWMNGVQMITSQLGFSLANASFSSLAKAIPS